MSSRSNRSSRGRSSRVSSSRSRIPEHILMDEPFLYVNKQKLKKFIDEPFFMGASGTELNSSIVSMTSNELYTLADYYKIKLPKKLDIANNDDDRQKAIEIISKNLMKDSMKDSTNDANLDMLQRFYNTPIIDSTGELSVSPFIMNNKELEMVSKHLKLTAVGSVTQTNRDIIADIIIKKVKPQKSGWFW